MWEKFLTQTHYQIIFGVPKSFRGAKGRHQKKTQVFFGVSPKGGEGGLAESKISLAEKTEIFLDFFAERGGVSPNPKGF